MSRSNRLAAAIAAILAAGMSLSAAAATLQVGPNRTLKAPCAAFNAAVSGDTIEIDAATYSGDVCFINPSNLTIRGVNGRPKIDAAGRNAGGKGTWVVSGANTTIENVEMFGAKVADQNGAAIRLDGMHLTLRGVYFHHNENGILTNNDGVSNIVVENSEFEFNGFGDGRTHNLYIGHVNSLIFKGNYSHDANVGHNLKSRANTNTITYNRFSSTYGQPSYEIDLPNAGTAYVIGNVIQQPPSNQNPGMLTFGVEGATNPGKDLYVINNTFLNDDSSRGTFVFVGNDVTTPVLMQNNVFSGTGTVSTQSSAIDKNNYRSTSPAFVSRAGYDLHPAAGSPMIDGGSMPGNSASGLSLVPTMQYKHTAGTEARPIVGTIDIGAYEAGNSAPAPAPAPVLAPAPAPAPVMSPTISWTKCAGEGGICSFSGTMQVRYGANGQYAYKSATGSISCTNDIFGDPVYGVAKTCEYSSTSTAAPTPVVTEPAPAPAPSWTACASEWSLCNLSGSNMVRYGAKGIYAIKSFVGSVMCTNDIFGDPISGVVKACEWMGLTTATPAPAPAPAPTETWSVCAAEWGGCSFSGTRQVRYGANGVFVTRTATGYISCTNDVFGDPTPGIVKSCSVSSIAQ